MPGGKRNGPAAVRMAVEMAKSKLITPNEAVLRVTPSQLDELLHPIADPKVEAKPLLWQKVSCRSWRCLWSDRLYCF